MIFANMNLDWQLGDVTTSAKGIKSAPLTDGNRQPELSIDNAGQSTARALWSIRLQRSSSSKKTICFRVHEELEASLSNVDAYTSDYMAKHANRLFKGKQMTYKPSMSLKEEYPALVRCKINMAGARRARFWDSNHARCDPPADLRDCPLVPRVQARSLWIMGGECGLCLDVCDLMCMDVEDECPFVEPDAPFLA